MESSTPIISVDDVSFSYGSDSAPRALDHVSLNIAAGDFLGIIGPSGAGKSTLTSVLSGAIPHHFGGAFYGAAHVAGQDTCTITLTDVARSVGSVLQDIDAQMVASVVEDELLFGLENFGVNHSEIPARIERTLELVGIADLRDREIATLSGGQKQKVAIAAILALEPAVLVLDEPTAALDPASSTMVFDILRDVNERLGVTVVIVEQKVALLSEYCRRIAVMDKGRIVLEGTPAEVFSHAAELRAIGVDSPRVTRISNSLAREGVIEPGAPCLNVAQAQELIAGVVESAGAGRANPVAGASAVGSAPSAPTPARPPHRPARPKAEGAEPVVQLRNVSFAYPTGEAAVQDVDITVYPGELVGVVGQNGAGKTTVTKLITGLLKPSTGTVTVAGLDTSTVRTSQIARHAATLFQDPDRQICRDTVLDEVAFGLELAGIDVSEARRRAQPVIERFGLPAHEAPFSLSRGQRQMVALASVVVLEPEVIILDEPTSGLDYRECMTVMETVSDMAEAGSAVIMVCHDMEVVSDFAERLVVMAGGRVLGRGETHTLFADTELMQAASMEPPQVIELSHALATSVSPTFEGAFEVADVVARTKELIARG
ncbi:ABC transporter ATP-binding protein [uncultured Enorma sp.]|uniref:ABC transporter ATP-binding protein n=1 Tax=uncultured Enorma sp. TaxID=1714346 RepID=UPI0026344B7A|nr:energy-coupling factor transporter ATPase [uncultured Enorma sp.]